MLRKLPILAVLTLVVSVAAALSTMHPVQACGGFFCRTSPVDQNAERIIFAQNHDGTMSTYIQIQYTGSAPDFSWILPVPYPLAAEDIQVPEDAMAAFTELEVATDPVFIPPPLPECAAEQMRTMAFAAVAEGADVSVHASGEVGPYSFDVISSEDPDALIDWLRENSYRVTPEMEPLIDVYVREGFYFLAMQLLPNQEAQDVQPVKLTYPSVNPMIPLRLTAVAANPDMAVMVWVYADKPAVPLNYAELEILDEDLTFTFFGNNNYRQLMGERADEYGGQGFLTEYAAPTRELAVTHPLLQELRDDYAYVTRLNTVISPEEMTVDPIFGYDPQRKDVSNIRDLSGMTGLFDCERLEVSANQVGPDSSSNSGPGRTDPLPTSRPDLGSVTGLETPAPTSAPPVEVVKPVETPEAAPSGEAPGSSRSWVSLVAAGALGAVLTLVVVGVVALGFGLGRRSAA